MRYALISGHPGGLTPGNPQAFVPRHLRIPPAQGQYSSTKSYHCPSPGEHNLKGLPNCNEISCIIFDKDLTKTYSCFEKGCPQYEENLNVTMSKVIMGNGGFTGCMIEAQGVSACRMKQ